MPTTLTIDSLKVLGIFLDSRRYGDLNFTVERLSNGNAAVFDTNGYIVATLSRGLSDVLLKGEYPAATPVEPPTFWERLRSGVE